MSAFILISKGVGRFLLGTGRPAVPAKRQAAPMTVAPVETEVRATPRVWADALSVGAVALMLAVFATALLPIARAPSVFPDSGTALSISRRLADGDWSAVWDTQSPLLQDGVYALMLKLDWAGAAGYAGLASTVSLAFVLGWILYRASGLVAAVGLPAAVMLFSNAIWIQAGYLTFYPAFAALGYAGLYVALRYLTGHAPRLWAPLAALLLMLALHAFTTALVFLAVPAIATLCFWSRQTAGRAAWLYVWVVVATGPWVAWHIAVGGPAHVYYHPYNWFTEKYLVIVNDEFWHYPHRSLWAYADVMGRIGLRDILPWYLAIFVLPGLVAVWQARGFRAVLVCVLSFGLYLALLLFTQPSPFARYYFPVIPLLVTLAAAGIMRTAAWLRGAPWLSAHVDYSSVATIVAAVVAGAALLPVLGRPPVAISDAQFRYVDRLDSSPGYQDLTAVADVVAQTNGGIISRDSAIQQLLPNNQVYTHYLLDEDEYVTYLSWPDDDSVIAMLEAHHIEWVLLRNDIRWERDFNIWLDEAYGMEPQHYVRIAESPRFDRVYTGGVYTLFRLRDPR